MKNYLSKALLAVLACFLLLPAMSVAQEKEKKETKTTATADWHSLSWKKKRKEGWKLMDEGYFFDAAQYLQAAYDEKPKQYKLLYDIGLSQLQARNYNEAYKSFEKLNGNKNANKVCPCTKYIQGIALKRMGQYEAAKDTFNAFIKTDTKKEEVLALKKYAKKEIQGIYYVDSLQGREDLNKITLAENGINTPYNEVAPFSNDGKTMYFSTQRFSNPNNLFQSAADAPNVQIYSATGGYSKWSNASLAENGFQLKGTDVSDVYINEDGNEAFYVISVSNEDGKKHAEIVSSQLVSGDWSAPKSLGTNINDALSNSINPYLAKNAEGKDVLFFASDRETGRGGFDIYMALRGENGSFGRAKNLGTKINTYSNEVTPYFDSKTQTLYFSSSGQTNIGGLDVFSSTLTDGTEWSDPVNMGANINSSADDYYYRPFADRRAFLVSNRSGGNAAACPTCTDDIYEIRTLKGNVVLAGTVIEEVSKVKSNATDGKISVLNENDALLNNIKVGKDGKYTIELDKELEKVKLSISKENFENATVDLNIGNYDKDTLFTNLVLVRNINYVGQKLGAVFFDFDKAILRPEAPDTMHKVITFIKQYPEYVIEVAGYTDDVGTAEYNMELSQERATAVNRYLLSKEVPQENTIVVGYGKENPLAPNTIEGKDNPEGRALNRRVEFVVKEEKKPE